jgi:hypothetical protein
MASSSAFLSGGPGTKGHIGKHRGARFGKCLPQNTDQFLSESETKKLCISESKIKIAQPDPTQKKNVSKKVPTDPQHWSVVRCMKPLAFFLIIFILVCGIWSQFFMIKLISWKARGAIDI